MKSSIYINREDVRHVEADEKYNFIRGVIELLELPLDDCFPEGDSVDLFTVENKINLRKSLRKYDVFVVDDGEGGVKIYFEDDVIAEWKKPQFILREDRLEKDRSHKLYIQMDIDFWTIFDEEIEESMKEQEIDEESNDE